MNILIEADAVEFMATLPDSCVDLILCDPPYGTTQNRWDGVIPFERMWGALKRLRRPGAPAVFTCSQPFTSALGASNIKELRYAWVWQKNRATGHLNARRMPMKNHEDILVFCEKAPPYYPQGIETCDRRTASGTTKNYGAVKNEFYRQTTTKYPRSILAFNGAVKPVHPTQKPAALMRYLIETYTLPGHTVLDFAMGSGTTGVAAKECGRDFIGVERDPEYFEIALDRIKRTASQ